MGKSTFRRLADVDPGAFVIGMNFIIAGLFFLIGSFLFWPEMPEGTEHDCETAGALLFVIGSIMYMGGAGVDYVLIGQELKHEAEKHSAGVTEPKPPLQNTRECHPPVPASLTSLCVNSPTS